MGIRFYKMTGSGNDFVMIDGRSEDSAGWTPERIRAVCDRRVGVGADGVVVLTPDGSETVRMVYYNADGSRAALCGNAALCSTRLCTALDLITGQDIRLLTDAGAVRCRALDLPNMAEVNVSDIAPPKAVPGVELKPGETDCRRVVVGVPHLVVTVSDVATVDVVGRGRALRLHPEAGQTGANVNFVSPPARPDEPWLIRTYERGVEGETHACGTGAVASAIALAATGRTELPLGLRTRGGPILTVRGRFEEGWAREVWLIGEGVLVFQGELAT